MAFETRPKRLAAVCFVAAILTWTATGAGDAWGQAASPPAPPGRLLLMAPDVQGFTLRTDGDYEESPEATAMVDANIKHSLQAYLRGLSTETVLYQPPASPPPDHPHVQLVKLHRLVARTIIDRNFYRNTGVPSVVSGELEWSLGPEAPLLGLEFGAGQALFLYFRASFPSTTRATLSGARAVGSTLSAVLSGFGTPALNRDAGGAEVGFASLVDLRMGEIVWFNSYHSDLGDLRDLTYAQGMVARLLRSMPK